MACVRNPALCDCLFQKSRIVGFKSMWVVLERGVLSYFQTRGDASTGTKRKGMKYLDEARLWVRTWLVLCCHRV